MSSLHLLALALMGFGFVLGFTVAWATTHPDIAELRRIRAFAEKQCREIYGTEAEHGTDSRCPDGDDRYPQVRP